MADDSDSSGSSAVLLLPRTTKDGLPASGGFRYTRRESIHQSDPMENSTTTQSSGNATFSVASLIAIAAAIGSFMVGAIGGLFLAVIAIIAGLLGVIIALSPAKRGGIASTMAVIAGGIGIIAAVIKAILWIF